MAELNLGGVGTLQAAQKFYLGKPFGEGGYLVRFFYSQPGIHDRVQNLFIPRVPEPSTGLLATVAALGLVMRSRSRN